MLVALIGVKEKQMKIVTGKTHFCIANIDSTSVKFVRTFDTTVN